MENIDEADTLPFDIEMVSPPQPTPFKPQSFDESDTRRRKFQGIPKDDVKTRALTPTTTASTPSERCLDERLLEVAEAESGNKVLVNQSKQLPLTVQLFCWHLGLVFFKEKTNPTSHSSCIPCPWLP